MFEIKIYTTKEGWQPFSEWLIYLKDYNARARIRRRLERIKLGNLGDSKAVGDGVYELRFFFGSGYRVYYAKEGINVILLLCGGDKSSQCEDIKEAKKHWNDYKRKTYL